MVKHRYTVGDLVRIQGSVGMRGVERFLAELDDNSPSGLHEITGLLPEELNSEPRYQITSCDDQVDRVVGEFQLIALPLRPQ